MLVVLKRRTRFDVIGAFILMLLTATYIVDRIVSLAIQPYLREYYNELMANRPHPIDAGKLVYITLFLQEYFQLIFCLISLIAFLIIRFNVRFRQFLREFGYAFSGIVVIRIIVVCIMRLVLKINP
ncbi:hypothetical protein ACFFGT_24830 [Mucilaginibacter angelicae]|uniref:Uncharacterized protein n=1 Tax=Mucilaginibacter angelicae TaxID=869718 RepID=A0ABV6LDC7_9SPHI